MYGSRPPTSCHLEPPPPLHGQNRGSGTPMVLEPPGGTGIPLTSTTGVPAPPGVPGPLGGPSTLGAFQHHPGGPSTVGAFQPPRAVPEPLSVPELRACSGAAFDSSNRRAVPLVLNYRYETVKKRTEMNGGERNTCPPSAADGTCKGTEAIGCSSDVSLPVRRRECARTVHVTGVRKGARTCENRGQRLRAARTQRRWREESRGKCTPTMIILDDDS